MRIILAIGMYLFESLAFCQGFNLRYDLMAKSLPQTAAGIEYFPQGYVIISSSSDVDSLGPELYFHHQSVVLTCIDLDGNQIWEKRAYRDNHSAFAGWANCCDTITGGGFVSGGSSEATDGSDEIYLMRFNAEGDTLWTRVFGDPLLNDFWIGSQVKTTPDGGFLIVGKTDAVGAIWNGFALKTDSSGNEQWRRTYPWTPSNADGLSTVDMAPGNTYYMGGSRNIGPGDQDAWVQRVDSLGEVIWRVSWGGPFSENGAHITTLNDGQPLIAYAHGFGMVENFPQYKPALAKLDSADGSIIWEHTYGPITGGTVLYSPKETASGDLIACGITYIDGGFKGLLVKANSEGDSLWMRSYFYEDSIITNGQGRFFDVLPTADGGFIAAGAVYNPVGTVNPPGYSQDTWVVKVDGDGCIIPGCNPVGITEQATNLLDALRIWPNPIQRTEGGMLVNISLDLPTHLNDRDLDLSVVSMAGKVVHRQRIINSTTPQLLQLPQLSSGLYHLHISSGSTWYTGGKLVVE